MSLNDSSWGRNPLPCITHSEDNHGGCKGWNHIFGTIEWGGVQYERAVSMSPTPTFGLSNQLWIVVTDSFNIYPDMYSDISYDHVVDGSCATYPGQLSWHLFWHLFWHIFRHIFSHILQQIAGIQVAWQPLWHIFWHWFWQFIWYTLWQCLTIFWHVFCHAPLRHQDQWRKGAEEEYLNQNLVTLTWQMFKMMVGFPYGCRKGI